MLGCGPYRLLGSDGKPTGPWVGATGVVYMRHNPMDTDIKVDQEKALMMERKGFNNNPTAKNVVVGINSHIVTKFPTRNIYQYDVRAQSALFR